MRENPLHRRSAGILLHITSLPGPGPVGDIGPSAHRFVEFLASAGQTFWQMLPIHPVGGGDSPYDSPSAFAGAPHLISLESLVDDGLLPPSSLPPPSLERDRVNFDEVRSVLPPLFREAFLEFERSERRPLRNDYEAFLAENTSWVWDFALYSALKRKFDDRPWFEWSHDLRRREPHVLEAAHRELSTAVRYHVFLQFCFHHQWARLRAHARLLGVNFMGDVPMFVAHDSVDVWANQHAFFLDENGQRTVQAGVPPDYFSESGQLWGNPLYRWDTMREDGYGWWIDRLRREFLKFDAVRLDHFIAFSRYWEIPITATSAKTGRFLPGPADDFFHAARRAFGALPFVAEDLGIVTAEVEALRDRFQLPGMKVLQFAFNPGAEGYVPHRHTENTVVYTGTHDNDTTRGWYDGVVTRAGSTTPLRRNDASTVDPDENEKFAAAIELSRIEALSGTSQSVGVTPSLIRLLYATVSRTAIIRLQDALNLDGSYRMNVPGVAHGNWTYRCRSEQLSSEIAENLRALAIVTERFEPENQE